jgi:hypothetical protein
MADRSKFLNDISGWPTMSDIQQGLVLQPRIVDEILLRLEQKRRCLLIGLPRSGKTTIARVLGWKITKGDSAYFRCVRYLDLAEIKDVKKDIQDIPLGSMRQGWLFIIDNWQAFPDCHEEILRRIRREFTRGFGVLFVFTQFSSDNEIVDDLSPRLEFIHGEEPSPIDTRSSMLEVARWMIDNHIENYKTHLDLGRLDDSREFYIDKEDYEQAIFVYSIHKKIRGNLRFLSWRLKAWDPTKFHLRELTIDKVLEEVRHQIVIPSNLWLGTLEKIASLSQWELPFWRSAGENAPDGIEQLVQNNQIIAIEHGTAWRMDSTDAYLLMLATSIDNWANKTLVLLKQYVELRPEHTAVVVRSIITQAIGDIKTNLVIGLLESQIVLEREKTNLLESYSTGRPFFYAFLRLVIAILRNLPLDKKQKDKRLNIAAVLLTEEVGHAFGEWVRNKSLFGLILLLKHLVKDTERFQGFVTAFFKGYGENNLLARLQAAQSGDLQRQSLKLIKRFDSSLRDRLRSKLRLRSIPIEKKRFVQTLFWLAQGSIETGALRIKKIKFIENINEDYLVGKLGRSARAIGSLQFLIQSAIWLSPQEASKFAEMVPRMWLKLDLNKHEAEKLSFLVYNCWSANKNAAQDLVDLVLDVPLHVLIPPEKAAGLGKLFATMEKVQPGVLQGWCRDELDFLMQIILASEKEEMLDDLIISLAIFAPDILVQVAKNCNEEIRQRLFNSSSQCGRWLRYGIFALIGVPWNINGIPELPNPQELVSCGSAKFIVALYGIQQRLSNPVVQNFLSMLSNMHNISPIVLRLFASYPMPWKANDIIYTVKTSMRAGIDQRTSAIHNSILATMMLPHLEWTVHYKFDIHKDGHRALETAIFENILCIKSVIDADLVSAILNEQNLFVQTVRKQIEDILNPIKRQSLDLTEWDTRLNKIFTVRELDYWRFKLLISGTVRFLINPRVNPSEIQFVYLDKPNRELLYELVGLSPPSL